MTTPLSPVYRASKMTRSREICETCSESEKEGMKRKGAGHKVVTEKETRGAEIRYGTKGVESDPAKCVAARLIRGLSLLFSRDVVDEDTR